MIAQYPPMGWNSWDCYGPSVTEEITKQNAEYMAYHLKEYGWEYIVVDIQWAQPTALSHYYVPFAPLIMDEYGRLIPAENRFPSSAGGKGFKPLSDYVHSLGLKFGIHIMRGLPRVAAHQHLPIWGSEYTCADAALENSICDWNGDMYGLNCKHPAARAYYESVFALYAEWGVDYVKVDDIAREYPHCEKEIELICDVCRNCGRDMVISLSPGPAPVERAEHLKKNANLWRITDDFWDRWDLLYNMFERAEKWCIHAGAGHWPDADMLPLGALRQNKHPDEWTRFTKSEQRTMMTLWCMMRSPLMIGGEMTKNDDFTLSLLTNGELLNIEKTTHCAHPLYRTEKECAWMAPRMDGKGGYIALFNLSDETREVTFQPDCWQGKARELWTGREWAPGEMLMAVLPPHDAAVWKIERD